MSKVVALRHRDVPLERLAHLVRTYDMTKEEVVARIGHIGHENLHVRTIYRWLSGESQCPGSAPIALACSLWMDDIMPTSSFVSFLKQEKP